MLVSPAVQQHAAVLYAQGHPGGRPIPGQDPYRRGQHEGKRHPNHLRALPQGWDRVWGVAGGTNLGLSPGTQVCQVRGNMKVEKFWG